MTGHPRKNSVAFSGKGDTFYPLNVMALFWILVLSAWPCLTEWVRGPVLLNFYVLKRSALIMRRFLGTEH